LWRSKPAFSPPSLAQPAWQQMATSRSQISRRFDPADGLTPVTSHCAAALLARKVRPEMAKG
jgi:hypothetical protein